MTGLYVLTNIMGAPPGDPSPEQIAAHCKAFQEGTSSLDKPAWDENTYYSRAGYKLISMRSGMMPEVKRVGVYTYAEPRAGHFTPVDTAPQSTWTEADYERLNKESKRTGGGERQTSRPFNFYLGE